MRNPTARLFHGYLKQSHKLLIQKSFMDCQNFKPVWDPVAKRHSSQFFLCEKAKEHI